MVVESSVIPTIPWCRLRLFFSLLMVVESLVIPTISYMSRFWYRFRWFISESGIVTKVVVLRGSIIFAANLHSGGGIINTASSSPFLLWWIVPNYSMDFFKVPKFFGKQTTSRRWRPPLVVMMCNIFFFRQQPKSATASDCLSIFEFRWKDLEIEFSHEHETLQTDSMALYDDDGMTAAEYCYQ